MKQKYDVVCIGDVVMDAFIGLKEARVDWDAAHEHPRALRCRLRTRSRTNRSSWRPR